MEMSRPKLLLLALSSLAPAWAVSQAQPASLSFDYVIVGGGNAGLTIANRLTENPSITVAVIEAGTFPEDVLGNITEVPGYTSLLTSTEVFNTDIEWAFLTTPQPSKNNTSVLYPRAKAFGGCSSINSMAYAHSATGAYQLLADTVGDQSFTYNNVVPYYKKSMDFTPPDSATRFPNATPSYHVSSTAQGGPLAVSYPSYATAWATWVAKGMAALGLPQTTSAIDGNLNGSAYLMLTVNHPNGHRASSETAFLRPYLGRHNLVLFNGTLAERIIFNSGKVATGVQVTTANTTYTLSATKEVIVSAGVFQSPQLLMVSGVGPAAVLKQHGIPVVANRPGVGQGMNDHLFVPVVYPVNLENIAAINSADVQEFNTQGLGPLTTTGSDYVAFEKIPQALRANWSAETKEFVSSLPSDWPHAQYLILPEALDGTPAPGVTYASIMPTLIAPQSRGNVSISSSKMSDPPLINPNWLATSADQEITIAAVKRAREFMASAVMSGVIAGEELSPGPSVQTDAQILAYIREVFVYMCHAHSTNQMGPSSNPLAVVDTTGKVFGVNNLRVVDASIFPFLLPGPSPQAHVYMLAEKLADDIKKCQ